MWETNAIRKQKKICKQSLPGFPGYVPVDVDVAKFVHANCMTDCYPTMDEPTEAYSQSITAFNCHNLTGMWLNVGGLYHLNCFECQPNPSPRPPQRLQPLVGPHCFNMATGQTRGGASVLHLVVPAAQALLWHAVCVRVCFSIFVGSQNWKPTYGLGSDNIVGTKMLNLIMQIINF